MFIYLKAIIFGLVQGITEFLPISSSGHLVVLHSVLELPVTDELVFDVVLHLATLLAVLIFFRREILDLLRGWLLSWKGKSGAEGRIAWFLLAGTIPAALAGYFLEDMIENSLRSPKVVIIMLILIAFLFVLFEKISKFKYLYKELSLTKVLMIGLAQALALIPGTSRSGITIIAGMGAGLKRAEAVKFSFLLSVPIILGASIKKIPPLLNASLSIDEIFVISISFLFAFGFGILAIKFLLIIAKKYNLIPFAIYRLALALFLYLYFF